MRDPVRKAPALCAAAQGAFAETAAADSELRDADAVAVLPTALARSAGVSAPRVATNAQMQRLRDELAAACEKRVAMAKLERDHGLNRYTLARQFRRSFGVSPSRFVTLQGKPWPRRRMRPASPIRRT